MIGIVQKEDVVLRETAKEIPVEKIGSKEISNIIDNMKKALDSQHDGVAIAAPQIGEAVRIFVVSGRVFDAEETGEIDEKRKIHNDMVFINPVIIKMSKKSHWLMEGCLSVRWLYGKVSRADKVTVKAIDENGEDFIIGADGLLAQIFQHETDHLNGTLFIDKAKDLQEMHPEEEAKLQD